MIFAGVVTGGFGSWGVVSAELVRYTLMALRQGWEGMELTKVWKVPYSDLELIVLDYVYIANDPLHTLVTLLDSS